MATEGDKIKELRDFFSDSFSAEELAMFLTVNEYEDVTAAVKQGVGRAEYFFEVARALERRRLTDDRFFERLRKERPNRGKQIGDLQGLWSAEKTASPEPSGGRDSSGTLTPQYQAAITPSTDPPWSIREDHIGGRTGLDLSDVPNDPKVFDEWGSPWRRSLRSVQSHLTVFLGRRVSLGGALAGAGLCLALAVLPRSVVPNPANTTKPAEPTNQAQERRQGFESVGPAKPTERAEPPELIQIEETTLVTPDYPYEVIEWFDHNSDEGKRRYKRMMPLVQLCKALHPTPGRKEHEAVVAIRSMPFERAYRAFDGSTICARAKEDSEPGPNSRNPSVCYVFLVTEEEKSTVLRSLTVSNAVPIPDSDYQRFTYSVPESRQADRLLVIIGLPKLSQERTMNERGKTRSGEKGFTITTRAGR